MAENPEVLDLNKRNGNGSLPDTSRVPLTEPMISVDVEDRLLRELKRRLFPNDIEGILYTAQTGDLYWQDQLWSLMVDTWPRLQTNLAKLKRAVSNIDYDVNPFVAEGAAKPTASALDKAEFAKRALFGMHGNPARQERDFSETLEDIIDSWVSGFTVMEIDWEVRDGVVPRCTRWIPARYYRYPYVMGEPDRLMLNPSGNLGGTQLFDFPPHKFIVAVKTSHANFPVFSASMRCLTSWWAASRFGLEWFMTYSQLYGIPNKVAYYEPGDDTVYQQLVAMMRKSGAATWGVYPRGTNIEIQTAAGAGGHMPQERLLNEADRVCDILLLGQTLTTDVQDSGSRALGTVHKTVWNEVMEGVANYAAKVVTTQLVPGIIAYNYAGDLTELPVVRPIIEAPVDLFALAQALKILCSDMKIPISLKDLYERIEFSQPEPEDELYEPPSAPPPPSPSPVGLFTRPGVTTPPGTSEIRQEEAIAKASLADFTSAYPLDSQENLLAALDFWRKPENRADYTSEEQAAIRQKLIDAGARLGITKVTMAPVEAPPAAQVERPEKVAEISAKPQLNRTLEESAQAQQIEDYFQRNATLITGVHWHSVIDDRTTEQCLHLDDKRWTYPDFEPIGHDTAWPGFPPIFYNCRSMVKPIVRVKVGKDKARMRARLAPGEVTALYTST